MQAQIRTDERQVPQLPATSIDQTALVTVVVPCFNQSHYLNEAIESVLSQTYRNFEIIVVDDGSTDQTAAVARRYQEVRYIFQNNRGLAAARNTGLSEASGDLIVFLDADDRLLPEALESGTRCLTSNPECAFAYGAYRSISSIGEPLEDVHPQFVETDPYAGLLKRNYIEMHATAMFRRAVLYSIGGYNSSLRACEDYEVYLRISRNYPVASHDEVVAEYRRHDSNMTRNAALMLRSSLAVLKAERGFVRSRPELTLAFHEGIRYWQKFYGSQLRSNAFKLYWSERNLRRFLFTVPYLIWYHPRGAARLVRDIVTQSLASARVRVLGYRARTEKS